MVLNLVALACMAGAILAAVILFRRHVRRVNLGGGGGSPNVCLRCGWPAEALTSFTCFGCGHDVREAGVGPRRRRSALRAFWTVLVFTCAYVIVATLAGTALMEAAPREHIVTRQTSMTVSSPEIRGVELSLEGSGPHDGEIGGTVTGELYGAAGPVVLEVDRPSLRWRLLDLAGKRLDAGDKADGKVVYRWMELAGAPTDTPVAHSDAAHIADSLGQLLDVKLEMPPVPNTGRALSLSYSAASGGGSSNYADPRWLPMIVIAGSALWLAGVWLVMLGHRPRLRRPAAPAVVAGEGVAP
jgi:hypothetical protein